MKPTTSVDWLRPWKHLDVPSSAWGRARVMVGGLTAGLLLLQVLTGLLLALHYRAGLMLSPETTRLLVHAVPYGGWLVAVHRISAHVLVAMMLFHGLSSSWSGAALYPRHRTFALGVGLLAGIFGELYTGTLLSWDSNARAATHVGLGLLETVPLIGRNLADLLRGGAQVDDPTLVRFAFLHSVLLPLLLGGLLTAHLLHVHARGLHRPGRTAAEPYWPKVAIQEAWLGGGLFALISAVAAFWPTLGSTTNSEKLRPPWPLLPAYATVERLALSSETPLRDAVFWGTTLGISFSLTLTVWKLISSTDDGSAQANLTALRAVTLGLTTGVLTLGLWGLLS